MPLLRRQWILYLRVALVQRFCDRCLRQGPQHQPVSPASSGRKPDEARITFTAYK